jgi:hypothetical protein
MIDVAGCERKSVRYACATSNRPASTPVCAPRRAGAGRVAWDLELRHRRRQLVELDHERQEHDEDVAAATTPTLVQRLQGQDCGAGRRQAAQRSEGIFWARKLRCRSETPSGRARLPLRRRRCLCCLKCALSGLLSAGVKRGKAKQSKPSCCRRLLSVAAAGGVRWLRSTLGQQPLGLHFRRRVFLRPLLRAADPGCSISIVHRRRSSHGESGRSVASRADPPLPPPAPSSSLQRVARLDCRLASPSLSPPPDGARAKGGTRPRELFGSSSLSHTRQRWTASCSQMDKVDKLQQLTVFSNQKAQWGTPPCSVHCRKPLPQLAITAHNVGI